MNLRFHTEEFTVCQLSDLSALDLSQPLFFLAKTRDELSLVCPTENVPANATKTESGWSMFRIEGQLDFSLVGILAKITTLLAKNTISVFAVSTFDTDYILVKTPSLPAARALLQAEGYTLLL